MNDEDWCLSSGGDWSHFPGHCQPLASTSQTQVLGLSPWAQPDTVDSATLGPGQVESSEGPRCPVLSDSANHLSACVLLLSSNSDVLNRWQMCFIASVISSFRREFHKLQSEAGSSRKLPLDTTDGRGLFTFAYIKPPLHTVPDAFPRAFCYLLSQIIPSNALPSCTLPMHSASLTASEDGC